MKMSRLLNVILSVACTGFLCQSHAFADLQRNPFEKKSEVVNKKTTVVTNKKIVPKKPPPRITSIIVAGSASLIKVGDEHYSIGETINGYTLAEVYESGAVFVKNSKRVDVKIIDD